MPEDKIGVERIGVERIGMERTRMETVGYATMDKKELFDRKHPVVRELLTIPEIIFGEEAREGQIALKELFLRENMDLYHVDCLSLYKIARHMVRLQRKLAGKGIYPGLYSLGDIYVNPSDSQWKIEIHHPEKFQLLELEQDFEWYPEDERIFEDVTLFDGKTQAMADQRLLYKILTASSKGNVKLPPRANGIDYGSVFYGTLPVALREVFEQGRLLSHIKWEESLDRLIASEEHFAKNVERSTETIENTMIETPKKETIYNLFILLRSQCTNSLEMSRMLYEAEEKLDAEAAHGHFAMEQAFVFGDGVIRRKDFMAYPVGYRVQIPQGITEYSTVEALLLGCEWMLDQEKKGLGRIYILSDGKIENNPIFHECLKKIERLKAEACQITLIMGPDAQCEGWSQLMKMIEYGDS